jgi:hypothetical protein
MSDIKPAPVPEGMYRDPDTGCVIPDEPGTIAAHQSARRVKVLGFAQTPINPADVAASSQRILADMQAQLAAVKKARADLEAQLAAVTPAK